jgi:hypothetical protein
MVKKLLLLALVVSGFTAIPAPARAAVSCTQDLIGCYAQASQSGSWLDVWAAGMDCELGYAGCVRRVIFG